MSDDKMPSIDDGEAKLSFDYDPKLLGNNIVVITMSNGGGFASLFCDIKDLEKFTSEAIAMVRDKNVRR